MSTYEFFSDEELTCQCGCGQMAMDDIKAGSRQKFLVMSYFRGEGMTRFGVARSFIHFDDLTEHDLFDEEVVWTY